MNTIYFSKRVLASISALASAGTSNLLVRVSDTSVFPICSLPGSSGERGFSPVEREEVKELASVLEMLHYGNSINWEGFLFMFKCMSISKSLDKFFGAKSFCDDDSTDWPLGTVRIWTGIP